MKKVLIAFIICIAATAFALEDTPSNRQKEAARYLKTTPPADMMKDMAQKVSMNLPPENREEFKALLTKHLDLEAFTKIMKDSMEKHFTADELKALADFYGSPVGKSAMNKFGDYMGDIMPAIQAELLKAHAEAIKENAEANRQKQNAEE
ncbi:DUF2059 domain-containing protein [Desulfosudis oleivorans]|uniref:DUF2059 domain-containing protein n=1 Tax=Desulfosudis oleivorans (strain DSM 6200 / JCM 39069 / Hxd3) TaxID=96561 RepID=A8ZTG5_DESOH|nr:DUF2059 domain-containing protein [Desulfosudis oleivorans]ABW66229.1 conserved hypothetical protein [Desulfosudis oleivorans Hxd3]